MFGYRQLLPSALTTNGKIVQASSSFAWRRVLARGANLSPESDPGSDTCFCRHLLRFSAVDNGIAEVGPLSLAACASRYIEISGSRIDLIFCFWTPVDLSGDITPACSWAWSFHLSAGRAAEERKELRGEDFAACHRLSGPLSPSLFLLG